MDNSKWFLVGSMAILSGFRVILSGSMVVQDCSRAVLDGPVGILGWLKVILNHTRWFWMV